MCTECSVLAHIRHRVELKFGGMRNAVASVSTAFSSSPKLSRVFLCSVIDHRRCQNVVRTSVTHSATPRVPHFCFYHILTTSLIYYRTDARQHGIYICICFI